MMGPLRAPYAPSALGFFNRRFRASRTTSHHTTERTHHRYRDDVRPADRSSLRRAPKPVRHTVRSLEGTARKSETLVIQILGSLQIPLQHLLEFGNGNRTVNPINDFGGASRVDHTKEKHWS